MEEVAKITSVILKSLASSVNVGQSLHELELLAENLIKIHEVESINKGYTQEFIKDPFPSVICIGVNDTIAHGIPDNTWLKQGDLVSFDIGIRKNGFCGDAALTVGVGEISNKDERLLYYAKKTLYEGIRHIRAGVTVLEIAKAIDKYAASRGYVTNKPFYGHGIGAEMHMDPPMLNFDPTYDKGYPIPDYTLKEREVICLEPMLTYRDRYGMALANGWTYKTRDGKNSAFFEHMIRVEKNGYTILTDHISEDKI